MATWNVQVEASFSDMIEVEADSYDEACEAAVDEFESNYMVVNSFALPWDNVYADSATEEEEDEDA
jgi:hypothetical protein